MINSEWEQSIVAVSDGILHALIGKPVSSETASLSIVRLEPMLSARIIKRLHRMGIYYVNELTNVSAIDLLLQRNFGEKSLTEIRATLKRYGLCLKGD